MSTTTTTQKNQNQQQQKQQLNSYHIGLIKTETFEEFTTLLNATMNAEEYFGPSNDVDDNQENLLRTIRLPIVNNDNQNNNNNNTCYSHYSSTFDIVLEKIEDIVLPEFDKEIDELASNGDHHHSDDFNIDTITTKIALYRIASFLQNINYVFGYLDTFFFEPLAQEREDDPLRSTYLELGDDDDDEERTEVRCQEIERNLLQVINQEKVVDILFLGLVKKFFELNSRIVEMLGNHQHHSVIEELFIGKSQVCQTLWVTLLNFSMIRIALPQDNDDDVPHLNPHNKLSVVSPSNRFVDSPALAVTLFDALFLTLKEVDGLEGNNFRDRCTEFAACTVGQICGSEEVTDTFEQTFSASQSSGSSSEPTPCCLVKYIDFLELLVQKLITCGGTRRGGGRTGTTATAVTARDRDNMLNQAGFALSNLSASRNGSRIFAEDPRIGKILLTTISPFYAPHSATTTTKTITYVPAAHALVYLGQSIRNIALCRAGKNQFYLDENENEKGENSKVAAIMNSLHYATTPQSMGEICGAINNITWANPDAQRAFAEYEETPTKFLEALEMHAKESADTMTWILSSTINIMYGEGGVEAFLKRRKKKNKNGEEEYSGLQKFFPLYLECLNHVAVFLEDAAKEEKEKEEGDEKLQVLPGIEQHILLECALSLLIVGDKTRDFETKDDLFKSKYDPFREIKTIEQAKMVVAWLKEKLLKYDELREFYGNRFFVHTSFIKGIGDKFGGPMKLDEDYQFVLEKLLSSKKL